MTLRPIPLLEVRNQMRNKEVADILRRYADYVEGDDAAVGVACFVMGEDGVVQSWIRAYDSAKQRLAVILQEAGDDLADGTYGINPGEDGVH